MLSNLACSRVRAFLLLIGAVVPILCLPGCGNKGGAKLVAVEGKVMLGGKLLATDPHTEGYVTLYPDSSKGNASLEIPRGTIDSAGHFTIVTGKMPGASPGWYKVKVDAAKVLDPKNPYHTASDVLIPLRYTDSDKSKLAFEVVENPASGAYDLKLEEK